METVNSITSLRHQDSKCEEVISMISDIKDLIYFIVILF